MKESKESDSFYSSLSNEYKNGITQVYYSNFVSYVKTTNEVVDRYLVIMTNGIYLIEKGGFCLTQIRIQIPFYALVSLSITGNMCSISSSTQQIRIKSDELNKIVCIVYYIREKQFPSYLYPIALNVPKDYDMNTKLGKSIYKTKNIFADRMTSIALYFGMDVNKEDIEMYNGIPPLPFHQFIINQSVLSSKLQKPLIRSLAFEQQLHTLVFQDCKLSHVLKQCKTIFTYNKCLSTLVFDKCDFTQSSQALSLLFPDQNQKLFAYKLVFKNCDLKTQDFMNFFEALPSKIKKITTLSFDHSEMNSKSLDTVIQSILFNEVFHSLNTLELISIGQIQDLEYQIGTLATCSWALTSKCIQKISASGFDFDSSRMLMTILNFDIGLSEIHLSNNNFYTRIPMNLPPKSACFLDLSSCDIKIQAISSLIEAFANKVINIYGLDLSSLRVSQPEKIQMLALMSSDVVVWPHLETFYFDNNRIGPEETILLSKFIKHQPSLKRISLNCSVDITKTSSALEDLFEAILEKPIEELYLRGDHTMDFSFGKLIVPFLQALFEKHSSTLITLDVSNQRFGKEGLDALVQMTQSQILEELRFDGFSSPSYSDLSQFCNILLDSQLKYASWPEEEFQKYITSTLFQTAEKNNISSEYKKLHRQFIETFGCYCDESDFSMERLNKRRCQSTVIHQNDDEENAQTNYMVDNAVKEKYSSFSVTEREPKIAQLLEECVGNYIDKDPVLQLISQIDKKLSYQYLVKEYL